MAHTQFDFLVRNHKATIQPAIWRPNMRNFAPLCGCSLSVQRPLLKQTNTSGSANLQVTESISSWAAFFRVVSTYFSQCHRAQWIHPSCWDRYNSSAWGSSTWKRHCPWDCELCGWSGQGRMDKSVTFPIKMWLIHKSWWVSILHNIFQSGDNHWESLRILEFKRFTIHCTINRLRWRSLFHCVYWGK